MGDTLSPERKLEEQTTKERDLMKKWFGGKSNLKPFLT